jgi:hypothetical protein
MKVWSGRFVLWLMIALMPMQGMAATAAMFRCHTDTTGEAPHAMQSPDAHAHSHDVNEQEGHAHGSYGSAGSTGNGHFCPHHFSSVLPTTTLATAISGFQVWTSTLHALHDLFVPDRPQRPPLA